MEAMRDSEAKPALREDAGDDPFAPFRAVAPGATFVVAQLGQSLDGRIATPTGASRYINGEAALDHLHRLRAAVDAVVVGIGTLIADDPMLNVRRVTGPHPARVVIDPNGRMPEAPRCLVADCAPRFVIRAEGVAGSPLPAGVERIDLPRQDGMIPPAAIVEALAARGLRRLLIEGGAGTISAFLAAGVLDRLHVLVAPMIIGSGVAGLNLPPIDGLEGAWRPSARVHILPDGDVLFDCDLRRLRNG